MTTRVTDDTDQHRFEARVGEGADAALAGFADYTLAEGTITFTHTEVDDAFEGEGVGSSLARAGLDRARAEGLRVVPRCPFIKGWIDKHPDYQDLVAS